MVSSQYFPTQARSSSGSAPSMGAGSSSPSVSPPWILDTLFRNFSYDLEQVADVIDPILTAQNHCHRTTWYIQGIVAGDRAFLSTNINPDRIIQVTLCSHCWLLGQGGHCAVTLAAPGIADCHAALNFDPLRGFFITDLGGESGTWVNGHRLAPPRRHYLRDGDLVQLGELRFEFLQQRFEHTLWDEDPLIAG
jgi:hypothetical protein